MTNKNNKILITGALGQIGSELTVLLRDKHGPSNVVASDIHSEPPSEITDTGPYEIVDVTRREDVEKAVEKYNIKTIFHMSAVLSATGEQKPQLAWDVNMNGTYNILETARIHEMDGVFIPSSIAAFGPETPRDNTPQETILLPKTIYGVSKVAGELLGDYYVDRFGLDVRGCRYPGIISNKTLPGGGTTDYAVAIFYEAVKNQEFTCFLREDTVLPMMYMPDCLKATVELMEADFAGLNHHSSFNLTGMSFAPADLAAEIKKHIPDFKMFYKPDYRQDIAETWPRTIDDSAARSEWGWKPDYDLASMTEDMIRILQKRLADGSFNY
jgi:nucleoside-diphosphate-sugar epimerase